MQEELEALASQATTNAMYIIKGEKHVFTHNGTYMTELDKMKAHVKEEKEKPNGTDCFQAMAALHSTVNTKDEVSTASCKSAAAYAKSCKLMLCWHTIHIASLTAQHTALHMSMSFTC